MALPLTIDPLDELPRTPASDVKKLGWRGVMKTVARTGTVVVTHHNEPEAVILSTEAYAGIREALNALADATEPSIESLRRRFDDRLAALQAAEAGERLRSLLDQPALLGGEVKAGATH